MPSPWHPPYATAKLGDGDLLARTCYSIDHLVKYTDGTGHCILEALGT